MEGCPSLVATSLPGKDRWALEEFMDTVMSADPHVTVRETRYRGVFVAFSMREPGLLASKFLAFTHAFIARVYPVLMCAEPSGLNDLVRAAASALRGPVRLEVRIREPLSRMLSDDSVSQAAREAGLQISKSSRFLLVIESIEDHLLSSYGKQALCGPRCRVVLPMP
ncbi:MAG: hypothetical protein ACP5HK_06940 [Acidilobus sp.]